MRNRNRAMKPLSRAVKALAACAIGLAWLGAGALAASATPDSPADVYVYWSYWAGSPSAGWGLESQGPGLVVPADASVQGWRYGAGSIGDISEPPRPNPSFDSVCGATPPQDGKKRVAVVIDSGTVGEAPAGTTPPPTTTACAQVDENANGLQALASVAPVRQNADAMVCGVNNYPASGCGQSVPVAALQSTDGANGAGSQSGAQQSTSWLPFAVGAILVVAIGVAAWVMSRRRPT